MAITSKHAKMADDEFKSSQMVDTLDQIELPMDILAEERTPTTTSKNVIFRMVKKEGGAFGWITVVTMFLILLQKNGNVFGY